MAKARSVKCSKCASPVDLSGLTWPSGEAPEAAPPMQPARPSVAAAMMNEQRSGLAYKDCAYCGEKVLASAIKCRHCGEFFDAAKVPPRSNSAAAAKVASGDDPNPAEYFVALLLAPIGLVIGLIWATRKQPKAKGVLKASVLSLTITVVAGLMTWQHLLREDNSGPSAASIPPGFVPPPQFVRVPDGEQPNPRRNNQGGRPGDSDAKTTSGNSGGGLYNAAGELIGINTTIAGGAIGFSIRPIDLKPEGLDLPANGETPAP